MSERSKLDHDECVLVVDDDDAIRKLLSVSLSRAGYHTVEAANGEAALDKMRTCDVQLVVLDLMMPIMSGWEVLRERENHDSLKQIPVIVVTAARGGEVAEVLKHDICALLPKPFDIDALRSLVDGCLHDQPDSKPPH